VEEWIKGKPAFPALASAFLVINADQLYGSMKLLTHGKKNSDKLYGSREWLACHKIYTMLFRLEDTDAWSRLYRRFFDEVPSAKALGEFSYLPMVQALSGFAEALKNLKGIDDLNHPPITDLIRTRLLNGFTIAEDESDGEDRLRGLAPLLALPSIAFTFRVFIPSIIHYRSLPATLLKRAIAGDIDALGCLFSLDKNLLHLPDIYAIWEPISRNPESATFKRLMQAMNRSPHRGLTPTRVKIVIAVAIEVLFAGMEKCLSMGQSISRPEIRALFDAYTQDTAHALLDEDLPGTDDGLDAAIRREKNAWIKALRGTA